MYFRHRVAQCLVDLVLLISKCEAPLIEKVSRAVSQPADVAEHTGLKDFLWSKVLCAFFEICTPSPSVETNRQQHEVASKLGRVGKCRSSSQLILLTLPPLLGRQR